MPHLKKDDPLFKYDNLIVQHFNINTPVTTLGEILLRVYE